MGSVTTPVLHHAARAECGTQTTRLHHCRPLSPSQEEEVDTEPVRTAIWYYVQRLFGVRNDHYDYVKVGVPPESALVRCRIEAPSVGQMQADAIGSLLRVSQYSPSPAAAPLRHCATLQVNKWMTQTTKAFAKKAACFPEAVTLTDFNSFTTLTLGEKVSRKAHAAGPRAMPIAGVEPLVCSTHGPPPPGLTQHTHAHTHALHSRFTSSCLWRRHAGRHPSCTA